MSNLLSQASLVMIPSGYKEDIVYSQIPTNGNGDLTFTRASNGTRINSAGLVEVCPWNLLQYSEDFANAYWFGEPGNTITSNSTTAPNGTLTADTITATNGFEINLHNFSSFTITANTYTLSQYLKSNGTNLIQSYIYNISTGFVALGEINFANETFTASIGNGSIQNVGNGWYRISLTASLASGNITTGFFTTSNTGTRSAYIWGAQLNIGSTAKPYFPTTDRLNVPRLTYQNGGGGCPSLLLEKQSTNLVTYSEQFDQWNTLDASITTNQITSPDGTQNADKFVENNQNQSHLVYSNTGTYASADYTVSVYAKAGERSILQILFNGSTNINAFANFDLTNGIAYATSSTATITSVGNGWYRCTITATLAAATLPLVYYCIQTSTSATRAQAYAGNGTNGLYLWGAQAEASSYPTSYIPTTSSSATRVADACYKTGISSLIGQTEGVVFYDGYLGNETSEIYAFLQETLGNSITSSMYLQYNGGQINFLGWNSSTTLQWAISAGGYTIGQRIKIAGAYKANDIVLYINGVQIGTDTNATIPTCTSIQLGSYPASPSSYEYYISKPINQAVLFKTRLTNAELASLTTI